MTEEKEEKIKSEEEKDEGLLVKRDVYLESGAHIGTKVKNHDMIGYIFKRRTDGLFIIDLKQTDEKLRYAASILSKYDPKEVLVVASRVYSGGPASKFGKLTDITIMDGRFVPGAMTNITSKKFTEPSILFVCDPRGERQSILEAVKIGIPVIALCDTDNETKFIDYVIPVNNKGRKSLALVFHILSREIMMKQGKIKTYDEFKQSPAYFEELVD